MSENKSFNLMSLAPDHNMAEDGVWLDFFDDSRLKIAQAQNLKHQAFLNSQYKIHRRKIDLDNKAADDLSEHITLEGLAKFVLKDWENITIGDVENVAYTPELGLQAMIDVPVLRKEVEEQSRRLQNFQDQENTEDTENVKTLSPGNSDGEAQSD